MKEFKLNVICFSASPAKTDRSHRRGGPARCVCVCVCVD